LTLLVGVTDTEAVRVAPWKVGDTDAVIEVVVVTGGVVA
jgi:hypothetical protein